MQRRDLLKVGAAGLGLSIAGVPLAALAQGREGGSLNIVIQPEPPGLVSGILQNATVQLVAGNLYEGLVRMDEKLEPHPLLAQSWEMSDDGLTYTFKLKPNVKWHDGKPFTAQDVLFSVDVFLRKTHARARGNLGVVEKITAPDDLTVVFELKRPFGPFLAMFETGSMPMLPKHIYDDGKDLLTHPAHSRPVGTGPYKFKEWVKGSYIHIDAFEDYHQEGFPIIKNMYFHVIPDAASRAAAFESGKIDVVPGGAVEYFDVERLSKLPGVQLTTKGWEFFAPTSWVSINNRNKPMDDARFRQALMYAMDREAMAKVAFYGFAKVLNGPCNSAIKFHTDDVHKYPRDLDKAKALLKEVGYKGESIRLLPMPYGETWQRLGEMIRQNLQQAGIKVEMVATDVAGWNQRMSEWDFDLATIYVYQYGDPALGVARSYITSQISKGTPFNNIVGYSNPKVDELFDAGAAENDPEKRAAIYKEVQQLLVQEVPVAWLHELSFPTLYRKVDNLVSSGIGLNDSLAYAKPAS